MSAAAKLVGMPLGPLQLVDETSIDLGVKIAKATKAAMGAAYPDSAVDDVLSVAAQEMQLNPTKSFVIKADGKVQYGVIDDIIVQVALP